MTDRVPGTWRSPVWSAMILAGSAADRFFLMLVSCPVLLDDDAAG